MEALNLISCIDCVCIFGMWGNVVGIRVEEVRLPWMPSSIKEIVLKN